MDALTRLVVTQVASPDEGVAALLARHHTLMRALSPEESCHVLSQDELQRDGCWIFACRDGGDVLGVGALKALDATHAELKSMHTAEAARGRGVGRAILSAILDAARATGLQRISLETGSAEMFAPARAFYAANGFLSCPPFGGYRKDPLSVFMTRGL